MVFLQTCESCSFFSAHKRLSVHPPINLLGCDGQCGVEFPSGHLGARPRAGVDLQQLGLKGEEQQYHPK